MAAQLNIKDPETVRLVREHAARTGRTVTATVRDAVEKEKLAREADIAERIRLINELVDEVRRDMPDEYRNMSSWEMMESMYDDNEPDGFTK
jgi:hypothetical protein